MNELELTTCWLTLVLRKGVAITPQTVFAPAGAQTQAAKGKNGPGTFKFILFPHFSEKNFEPTTFPGGRVSFQSWEVGGGWAVILKFDYFENI